VLGALGALEIAYHALLPHPLPERAAEPLPREARSALWLDAHSSLPLTRPFAYPFLLSVFIADDMHAFSLQSHVARLHILSLRQRGLVLQERQFQGMLRELALATWIARRWTTEETWMSSGTACISGMIG
jgi:hypothetical protein